MSLLHACRGGAAFWVVVTAAQLLAAAPAARAETRFGVSGLAGLGLFVAAEDELYGNVAADIYPEVAMRIDVSALRFGGRFGFIYRNFEAIIFEYDPYSGYSYSYVEDFTRSFIPVQAEFLVAPLDLMSTDPVFSPYFGGLAGYFVSVGDDDKSVPALSLVAGAEIHFDPVVAYLDARYTRAKSDDYFDANFGGVTIVAGFGLRLGTGDSAF